MNFANSTVTFALLVILANIAKKIIIFKTLSAIILVKGNFMVIKHQEIVKIAIIYVKLAMDLNRMSACHVLMGLFYMILNVLKIVYQVYLITNLLMNVIFVIRTV